MYTHTVSWRQPSVLKYLCVLIHNTKWYAYNYRCLTVGHEIPTTFNLLISVSGCKFSMFSVFLDLIFFISSISAWWLSGYQCCLTAGGSCMQTVARFCRVCMASIHESIFLPGFFATAGNQGRNVWRNSPCNWFLEPVCSVWATRWMPRSPLTCSFSSSYNISTKMREFSCFKMALGLFDFGWSDILQQLWLRRLF